MSQPPRVPDQCIFCAILEGTQSALSIASLPNALAVVDIHPAVEGHSLILPGVHVPLFPMIPPDVMRDTARLIQAVSRGLMSVLRDQGVEGTSILIPLGAAAGQRAPHALIHCLPRRHGDALFTYQREQAHEESIYATARAVRDALARIAGQGGSV